MTSRVLSLFSICAALFFSFAIEIAASTASLPGSLDTRAVPISGQQLSIGDASIVLSSGKLVPVIVNGVPVAAVFVGDGTVRYQTQDAVESSQIELFTGNRTIDAAFHKAVFTIVGDSTFDALLKKSAVPADAATSSAAAALLARWNGSAERSIMGIDGVLFAATTASDPAVRGFACAWLGETPFGDFVAAFDPRADEQVTIGQFVPIRDMERRSAARELRREQRRGRLLGLSVEDLGTWDTWVSSVTPCPADCHVPFEASSYTVGVTIEPSLRLDGDATVHAKAGGAARSIELLLLSDFDVKSVADDHGAALPFLRSGNRVTIALPKTVTPGGEAVVRVQYAGEALEKKERSIWQRDALAWYPHVGAVDRATYDVTFHWPSGVDLLAGGKRVGGGTTADTKWERRTLDIPSGGFTFELGHFTTTQIQAGHITVALAFDPSEDMSKSYRSMENDLWGHQRFATKSKGLSAAAKKEIADHVAGAIKFEEAMYGPLPLDEMTVLNVSRNYSQAMLGFVTLSTAMMADTYHEAFTDLMDAGEDRRTVIAHEIAHQWWAHIIGWRSYRDQWLSEGMASWTALQYGRTLDWAGRLQIGPTSDWNRVLTSTTDDGRRIESLGPLVLGTRLNSSRSEWAYQAMVYKKAPVVLDMLSNEVGPESFKRSVRALIEKDRNSAISTSEFLNAVTNGRTTTAARLVYTTGIPVATYTYRVEPNGGKSALRVSVRQESGKRNRFVIARRSDGKLEVTARAVDDLTVQWRGRVPIELRADARTVARSRMDISSDQVDTTFDLPFPPQGFAIDPDGEVLAKFYDEEHDQKRALLYRGRMLMSQGKFAEAAAAFESAFASKAFMSSFGGGVELGGQLKSLFAKYDGQVLNASICIALTRAYIEMHDAAKARDALRRAHKSLDAELEPYIASDSRILESRIDVLSGDYAKAYSRLSESVTGADPSNNAEALATFAVACSETGHKQELAEILERCRRYGVDVSAIEN